MLLVINENCHKFFSIQMENIGSGPVFPVYTFKVFGEDKFSEKTKNHAEQKNISRYRKQKSSCLGSHQD